jgi:hypothetical protein
MGILSASAQRLSTPNIHFYGGKGNAILANSQIILSFFKIKN